MKVTDKYTFFWGSYLSQWHPCKFTAYAGIEFNCAEQYMMYSKAVFFNDFVTAQDILLSTNPKDQKALGRAIKNFNHDEWNERKYSVVLEGNRHKFGQNPDLMKKLLSTYPTQLVEASPVDKIWGIGLHQDDPRIEDESQWQGENLLGKVLTQVRDEEFSRINNTELK